MTRARSLLQFTMGPGALFTESVVSSSPQTVLVGGIPTMVGTLGVAGVPLAFVVVALVLRLLLVGPTAVARHVKHGAPFYAQLAQGVGPTAALMAAGVGLVGYNCLQNSLYLLIGNTMTGLAPGVPWWVWAGVAWLLVMASGHYPGHVIARVLGMLLAVEVALIVFFIVAGFTHPAGGHVSLHVWAPSSLVVSGQVGGALVFAFASYAGLESVLAFGEEAKNHTAMSRAIRLAVSACGGLLYPLAAWAYLAWIGVGHLSDATTAARQPLVLLGATYGNAIYWLATLLLVTSGLAAAMSFHAGFARQIFALAREGVVSPRWGKVTEGEHAGAPLGGTVVQAVVAAIVLAVCAGAGFAPMSAFVWLSAVGAFCVLLLLVASSASARAFFARGRGTNESLWKRQAGPFGGAVLGFIALVLMASNLDKLLGTAKGSVLPWLVAVPVGAAVLGGAVAGAWLRRARPHVYAGIGHGAPDPKLVQDHRLGAIPL